MNGEEMYDSCLTENMTLGTQTGDTGEGTVVVFRVHSEEQRLLSSQ